MTKTFNRGLLKKAIQRGKMEARCIGRYTDDYAYDAETNFGKTNWQPAYFITKPTNEDLEAIKTELTSIHDHLTNNEVELVYAARKKFYEKQKQEGISFEETDFTSGSGRAYHNPEAGPIVTFLIHSNLTYELRPIVK